MKQIMTALAALAILPAGMALADDDCHVPPAEWQPLEAVLQLAGENGWTLREIEVDDGCYEVQGETREGRRLEAKLDPKTLEVIKIEEHDVRRRDSAPPATATPPAN